MAIQSTDLLDRILTEIAIRIQLPPSKYQIACDRYAAVAAYAEREGSPLRGKISRFYPQGSMSIGATIAARGKDEEYDIDIVAELLFRHGLAPETVLNILYEAISGEPGSRYHGRVKRRTRCITVYYQDGMHLDITPVVLRPERLERTSNLFHDAPDQPEEPAATLLMNAWGFSQEFKLRTADSTTFADSYARSSREIDIHADAETDEVDPQEDPARKSSDVVALQLIKHYRNTRYADRAGRMPPSILLSKYVSDAAQPVESLSQALIWHTQYIRKKLVNAEANNRLVYEVNPTCSEDCFTDRWPLSSRSQHQFISDLNELLEGLQSLTQKEISVREMQELLKSLFGEKSVLPSVRAVQAYIGAETQSGTTLHKLGGGIVIGASEAAKTARASTNMGGKFPGK